MRHRLHELNPVLDEVQKEFRIPVAILDVESATFEFMKSMTARIEERLGYQVPVPYE